ncbi:phosphotransferase enzyme family protein [Amycolatopsis rubida]|uniref:phosphotransferase enzyme family protein n=1 Tax=Amycolatopsis rubida TaxID=112413 RepID=UPI000B86D53E|nr:aminoglycoside phosphotransferase family protein [Amycolatopsis rubida]
MADSTGDNTAAAGESEFSPAASRATLTAACREVGFNPADAELIRLGENAIYRLSDTPVVVRIARTMDYWSQVQNEVLVSKWLSDFEFPAARVIANLPQPIEAQGHPVTFWEFIPGRVANPNEVATLGTLLRRFHDLPEPRNLPDPSNFELPSAGIESRLERRLETSPAPEADKSYILAKFRDLRDAFNGLDWKFDKAPVHGDGHIQNLMISTDGSPVLIDFERTGWGHPELDLAVTATEYTTAKWWTDEQYADFADAYGYDITRWSGFDVVRQLQEIKMTTWIMQNIDHSEDIKREFDVRMHTIRTGEVGDAWSPR